MEVPKFKPGIPTVPQDLQAKRVSAQKVLLYWQPSVILDIHGNQVNKPIIGKYIVVASIW